MFSCERRSPGRIAQAVPNTLDSCFRRRTATRMSTIADYAHRYPPEQPNAR